MNVESMLTDPMHTKNPALRRITLLISISLIPLMSFGEVNCSGSNGITQAANYDCESYNPEDGDDCYTYWGCTGGVARNCRTSKKHASKCEAGTRCKGNDRTDGNPNQICNDSNKSG